MHEKAASIDWLNVTRNFESDLKMMPFETTFIGCGVTINWGVIFPKLNR